MHDGNMAITRPCLLFHHISPHGIRFVAEYLRNGLPGPYSSMAERATVGLQSEGYRAGPG